MLLSTERRAGEQLAVKSTHSGVVIFLVPFTARKSEYAFLFR
jgi:hypothetical protein